MAHDIAGIILAAGRSTRMGRPKLALPIGAESFLDHAARALAAARCVPVIAVVNEEAAATTTVAPDVQIVVNREPRSEQIDSLRLALERLDGRVAAVLVLPVDLPLLAPESATAVADSFRERPAPIIAPFYGGVAGHPVLLARELFDELLLEHWAEGVRSVIMKHAAAVREVAVSDPGILIDIDTPVEYQYHVGGR